MENAGARLQESLKDLPRGGLSALTRVMSMVSVAAAGVVVLYAVTTIVLGTITLMAPSWHWSIGKSSPGAPTVVLMSATQGTTSVKSLDMNCAELKKPGGDVAKCLHPDTRGAAQIAAENQARQTLGNWFNASIRPVFWSLPVFLLALGLVEASRCLKGLAAGRPFTADTVTHLRNFAIAGLLYVLLTPCMPVLASGFYAVVMPIEGWMVRTWSPHHTFTFVMPTWFEASSAVGGITGFSGFLIGLYAFTLAVIATVMARASAIVEDHAEII